MINKEILINILKKLYEQSKICHDEFNSVDGKIGDGDLGITILHGLEEIINNINNFTDDLGSNFMICSKSFVKRSGSSFGTLIAFSLMNISKNFKEKSKGNHQDIINIFQTTLNTIKERGKTKLGDKTIVDTLDLVIKKLQNNKNYPTLIKLATKEAIENFKGKKILIGRARMFEEKTKDLDDPGMYALYKLCQIF
ncbi:MAG: dihydroxyacetone kinase subunit L [Candidatus Pelagibacter sp.]